MVVVGDRAGRGEDQEPHVEMQMGRLAAPLGDLVHVEVDRRQDQ